MAATRPTGDDIGKFVLRIALGGIILFHGVFKLSNGVEWIREPLASLGLPGFLAYGAYVGEVLAPLLLIAGYKVRIAALLIAFDMLMAIILVLRPQVLAIKEAGGGWAIELEALLLLVSLGLTLTGGGRLGLERAPAAA